MNENQMAPEASPAAVSPKNGVRRVNNVPMYLIGGVLSLFFLVLAWVAADRSAEQNQSAGTTSEQAGGASMFAHEIVGSKKNGMINAQLSDTGAQAPTISVARPDNLDQPPLPQPGLWDASLSQILKAKFGMLEEAIKATTDIGFAASRSPGSTGRENGAAQNLERNLAKLSELRRRVDAARPTDPTAAYQTALAQAGRNKGEINREAAAGSPSLLQQGDRNEGATGYSSLDKNGEGDRWRLDSQLEAPGSPFELRAGFIIPAMLISGINSDLPGQIVAQVSQNIYDTPTGKYVLIPQGARLVGSYSSDVEYGQARVMVGWQRIVFPDGKAMDIGAMPGSDSAGYSGFKDQVNNHYIRIFGSAVLMSGIVAGVSLSQNKGNSGNQDSNKQRASDSMSESLGQILGETSAQMISKNLNISPTLEVRPGYRFNVVVTKDMTFSKPYQAFDY